MSSKARARADISMWWLDRQTCSTGLPPIFISCKHVI
jgi:hypothetical protein